MSINITPSDAMKRRMEFIQAVEHIRYLSGERPEVLQEYEDGWEFVFKSGAIIKVRGPKETWLQRVRDEIDVLRLLGQIETDPLSYQNYIDSYSKAMEER